MTAAPCAFPARPARHRTAVAGRRSFLGLLGSEAIKITSLTSMRWLATLVVAIGVVGAAMFSAHTTNDALVNAGSVGAAAVAILGALATASEYANGSIRTTMTAEPRRARVVLARAIAVGLTGALLGVVTGSIVIAIHGIGADPGAAIIGVFALGAYLGVVAAFMSAVGFVVRSVPVAVTIAVALLFLLPGLLGGVSLGDGAYLSDWSLAEAGLGLVAPVGSASWADAAVMLAWPAAALAAAVAIVMRRDS